MEERIHIMSAMQNAPTALRTPLTMQLHDFDEGYRLQNRSTGGYARSCGGFGDQCRLCNQTRNNCFPFLEFRMPIVSPRTQRYNMGASQSSRISPPLHARYALPDFTDWCLCRRLSRFNSCFLALACWERPDSLSDRVAIYPEHRLRSEQPCLV